MEVKQHTAIPHYLKCGILKLGTDHCLQPVIMLHYSPKSSPKSIFGYSTVTTMHLFIQQFLNITLCICCTTGCKCINVKKKTTKKNKIHLSQKNPYGTWMHQFWQERKKDRKTALGGQGWGGILDSLWLSMHAVIHWHTMKANQLAFGLQTAMLRAVVCRCD